MFVPLSLLFILLLDMKRARVTKAARKIAVFIDGVRQAVEVEPTMPTTAFLATLDDAYAYTLVITNDVILGQHLCHGDGAYRVLRDPVTRRFRSLFEIDLEGDAPRFPTVQSMTGSARFVVSLRAERRPSIPTAGCDMPIFVRLNTGKLETLLVSVDFKIEQVMEMIRVKTRILPRNQRLLLGGRQLEHGFTLSDYRIQRHATLHLCLRLRGGMMHVSSGRADYCSTRHPGTDDMECVRVQVDLGAEGGGGGGGGAAKELKLWCHPGMPLSSIEWLVNAETDPRAFEKATRDALQERAHLAAGLSTDALRRYTEALALAAREEEEEEEEESQSSLSMS